MLIVMSKKGIFWTMKKLLIWFGTALKLSLMLTQEISFICPTELYNSKNVIDLTVLQKSFRIGRNQKTAPQYNRWVPKQLLNCIKNVCLKSESERTNANILTRMQCKSKNLNAMVLLLISHKQNGGLGL